MRFCFFVGGPNSPYVFVKLLKSTVVSGKKQLFIEQYLHL